MSVKMVKCYLCGKEVTKRQSLAFETGRACREHPEVIEMVVNQNKKELLELTDKQLENWRQVLCRMLGPIAFMLTAKEIQDIRDNLQKEIGNV